MMKRVLGFLVLALYSLTGMSQAPASSLLWEVSGNGLKSPSYIFGTFHIMCKSDFAVSETLKNKLSASKQFYGEIDMGDMDMQMKLMMKMMMTDKTLSGMMTEAEFKKLGDNFQQITGMPLSMFNSFKPFAALSLITINSIDCSDKVQPETELITIAKQNNIPLFGLETVDDQAEVLNSQPIDSQVLGLKKILLNFDSVKHAMKRMIAVYQQRDIDSLHAFMNLADEDSEFQKELLDKRNHKWIPLIEKAAADKPSFFAVGSGHLGGPEGVINLLRKRGYTLTPVRY